MLATVLTWGVKALAIPLLLFGCSAPPPHEIGVQIVCGGPDGVLCPPGEFRLEIGSRAWELNEDGGVALIPANAGQKVRLLEARTCDVLAAFDAQPDHRYLISITSASAANVTDFEDLPGNAFETGPSMGEGSGTDCP